MSKIRDWFTKNIFWKLLSLFLAILIWFFVINIQNPAQTRTYDVAVKLINLESLEDQKLTLTNQAKLENTKIQIEVRGKRLALDRLDDKKNEITATLDTIIMRGSNISDPIKYSVDVKLPYTGADDQILIISKRPEHLEGNIDSIVTVPKKVDVFPTGTIAEGYDEISTEITPAFINLTGAESLVNKVASVKVNIDIDGAKSDVSLTAEPKLYDSLGNEILGVMRDADTVDINIKINKYAKVPLVITNRGTPMDGYVLTDFSWEPEFVEVVGSEEAIDELKEIKIQINLQGRNESSEELFDLRQRLNSPDISIKNGTTNQAKVFITIKPLGQKELTISTDTVSITGRVLSGVEYSINPQDIIFTISGLQDTVRNATADKITASVDITGYEEGIHNIPLKMVLPQGITIVTETPSVIVEIKGPNSDPDPNPESGLGPASTDPEESDQDEPQT